MRWFSRAHARRSASSSTRALELLAAEVAARQAAALTRAAYASVYRPFCQFVGPDADAAQYAYPSRCCARM